MYSNLLDWVDRLMLEAAKLGDPQAIAALINKILQPQGMVAKVALNKENLIILVEGKSVPVQASLVDFFKKNLNNLRPSNITQVTVRGKTAEQTSHAWQTSFPLDPIEGKESNDSLDQPSVHPSTRENAPKISPSVATSISQPTQNLKEIRINLEPLTPVFEFMKTRNGERVSLVVGTFLVTALLFRGLGWMGGASSTTQSSSSSDGQISLLGNKPNYAIRGSLKLVDSNLGGTDSNCYGTGGYSDIQAGMPVTIRDGQGKILATGSTGSGSHPNDETYGSVQCVFNFQLENIPKADFYSIEVGHRGQLNYSFTEMEKRGWQVSLSLS